MSSSPSGSIRLLVIGSSATEVCGVRDYAHVVGDALREEGARVEFNWWERNAEWSLSRAISEQSAWLERVSATVGASLPDWIIWHYSVFAWGKNGIPYLVPGTARRLRRLGVPIVLVAHELVFPFGRAGWKGCVWATTQRFVLIWPVRVSSAVIVTTGERLRWLQTRRWLPERPSRFLPVCSNVPAACSSGHPSRELVVGVFGFGIEGALARETMGAVARLRADGTDVRALLIGAPGESGAEADRWRAAAREAGIADAVAFTGVLPPDELARALTASDVVILPDPGGPSARKGTLAAGLALGRPVVATDGPERWEWLIRERAVVVAEPSTDGLSRSLSALLRDPDARRSQAARGSVFYHSHMAPDVVSRATLAAIGSPQPAVTRA